MPPSSQSRLLNSIQGHSGWEYSPIVLKGDWFSLFSLRELSSAPCLNISLHYLTKFINVWKVLSLCKCYAISNFCKSNCVFFHFSFVNNIICTLPYVYWYHFTSLWTKLWTQCLVWTLLLYYPYEIYKNIPYFFNLFLQFWGFWFMQNSSNSLFIYTLQLKQMKAACNELTTVLLIIKK